MGIIDQYSATLFATAVLHLLWLACLPWLLWIAVDRLIAGKNPNLRYSCNLLCLIAIVAMVPVSFWVASFSVGTSDTVSVAAESVVGETGSSLPDATSPASPESSQAIADKRPTDASNHSATIIAQHTSSRPVRTTSATFEGWAVVIFIAYLVGVVICSIRFARGVFFSRQLRQQAHPVTDSPIRNTVVRLTKQLQLRKNPVVMWCAETAVPSVVGVLKPVVLLPIALATEATSQQIEHVLMHEFIHLRRFDPMLNCLQNIIETLLFFHPVVWKVSSQVRLHREISCDAAVIAAGADVFGYANTLTDVATTAQTALSHRQELQLSVPATSSESELRLRIEQMLGKPAARTKSADGLSFALLLFTVVSLATLVMSPRASGADDDQEEQPIEMKMADLDSLTADEFAGIVQDDDGNPIEGATINVWHWNPANKTKTDSDGFFRFKPRRNSFDGTVEVRITKPGYAPYYNHLQEIGKKDFVVTLNQNTYVEGKLTDAQGNPAAKAEIQFDQGTKRADGVTISSVISKTTTDADGNYRIYLAPDSYSVKVQGKSGIATSTIDVTLNESSRLDLNLHEGVNFRATVVDSQDKPYEGFALFTWQGFNASSVSGPDGKIAIDGLVPGEMEFSAGSGKPIKRGGITAYQHGELGRWWSESATNSWQRYTIDNKKTGWQRNFDSLQFDLQPGMEPVKIVVERGVTFKGHVYDPDGNPVAGATVAPAKTGSGNSLTGDTRYSVKTKKDGSYRVVMPAGKAFKYNLMVHDGDYQQWRKWANGVTEPIETQPGQVVTDFDLKLTRGGTVKGSITNPRAGLKVRAISSDLRGNRYYTPTAKVAADGTFEIKFVRPGKNHIQVSLFWLDPTQAPEGTSIEVELDEGETLEDIELTAADQ